MIPLFVFAALWVGIPLLDTIRHFQAYRNHARYGLLDPRVWKL